MRFAINIRRTIDHAIIIDEELRKLALLDARVKLHLQSIVEMDPETYRLHQEILSKLSDLRRSVEFRRDCLQGLAEEFQALVYKEQQLLQDSDKTLRKLGIR